jgi:hypothetical protein
MTDYRAFFDDYARRSQTDPRRLAELYAPGFIAGGPKGSAIFTNDDSFRDWLHNLSAFNQQRGLQSMQVTSVETRDLSRTHAVATVTWEAHFSKTGDQAVRFDITYLMEDLGPGPHIRAYISHTDEEEEMKRLGLSP